MGSFQHHTAGNDHSTQQGGDLFGRRRRRRYDGNMKSEGKETFGTSLGRERKWWRAPGGYLFRAGSGPNPSCLVPQAPVTESSGAGLTCHFSTMQKELDRAKYLS
ncbi:hypothetical protein OPV22_017869 [Ensete ventricosum]|uniref:Uncharacterized protein n=1 Tax=Ensete ventricosum TaxID=4639 RepID=A0AAV8R2Y4_ENSVE|nr:hypothetical protein OPV22_017869 [Ensete ventricosum]